jgi:hypothetical protein
MILGRVINIKKSPSIPLFQRGTVYPLFSKEGAGEIL